VPFVANVEEVCESLGVAYQCCSSKDARKPRKQYLMATGREIETKVNLFPRILTLFVT